MNNGGMTKSNDHEELTSFGAAIKRRAIRGTIWSAVASSGEHVLNFLLFIVLARILDPETFGIFAIAMVVVGFGAMLVGETFSDALIQRKLLSKSHFDSIFWFLLLFAAVLSLLAVILSGPVASFFGNAMVASVIVWTCPVIVLAAISAVPMAVLKRKLAFKSLAGVNLAALFAGGLVGVTMALLGYGIWSLVGQFLVQKIVEQILVLPLSGWTPGRSMSFGRLRELFAYGSKTLGLKIVLTANDSLPRILVGLFYGLAPLGLYNLATRIYQITRSSMVQPISQVAMPVSAKVQDYPDLISKIVINASRITALIACPSFIGMSVVAPEFVPLLFGMNWVGAVEAVQLLVVSGLTLSLTQVNASVLRGLGLVGWRLILALVQVAVMTVLLVSVGRGGLTFVALAVFITACVMLPIKLYMFQKVTNIPVIPQVRAAMPAFLASLVMALVVSTWQEFSGIGGLGLLLTEVVLGVSTYLGMLFVIDREGIHKLLQVIAIFRTPNDPKTI